MRVFLDVNVIIDFLNVNRSRHNIANQLFIFLDNQSYKVSISEDILTNIFYISKNKKHALQFLKVIQNKWEIAVFGAKVIEKSIELSLKKKLDFEDVLQCFCAVSNNCDYFITNDKDFYDCGINIYTTEEFLKRKKQ